MVMDVTRGAVANIYHTKDTSLNPVLQITELKKISQQNANPNGTPRFRLAVSDGETYQQAMLATQLNNLVINGAIELYSLVRLSDYICNEVQNKRIIIILNLEPIGKLPGKIGNPGPVDGPKPDHMSMGQGAGVSAQAKPPGSHTNQGQGMNSGMNSNTPSGFGGGANGGTWNAVPPSNAYGSSTGMAKPENRMYGQNSSGIISSVSTNPTQTFRPIQSINPYQNGWVIRGRCTYKSDIRRFQNARGEGQVISFELTDESGSIRITAFTDHAQRVDQTIHQGKVYSVTRGSLKRANENFNRSTSQYEMTLDRKSEFSELEDDGSLFKVKYNFTKIAQLDSINVKGSCDVLAIVQEVGPLSEIILRSTGEPCKKRPITLVDDSNASVELTLWRNHAETFLTEADQNRHPVILLKNAIRGDFGGVCLNFSRNTAMELDPVSVPEANQLRAWYDTQGGNSSNVQALTAGRSAGGKISGERKSLEEAQHEEIDPVFSGGSGGASASFVSRGYISLIKSDGEISYPSDPGTKKKVALVSPGLWHSPSTNRELRDEEVVHRYMLNLKIADHTGSQWMSAFDESGKVILQRDANEMRRLKETDFAMFDSVIDDCKFRPLVMRVNVKEQSYRGENQIRYTLARCEALDFASEGRLLLEEIKKYDS